MKIGSLFSGIGGLELGLERAGLGPTTWQVELDDYCRRVLAKHWPDAKRYGDIRKVDARELEPVFIVAGGFPCQDISNAHTNGPRRSLEGAHSGLWHHFWRVIDDVRPRWAVIENVAAWRRWVPDVGHDLAGIGYASVPLRLSAGSFGAPHRRPRVFVVAHSDGQSEPLSALHAAVARLQALPRRHGHWRLPPPGGFRVADGIYPELDSARLRALGNAVVPQVAEFIGQLIVEREAREEAA